MIRHIVMWKVKESAHGLSKTELIQEMRSRLETLPKKLSWIRYFQVGLNQLGGDTARDIVLVADFDDLASLKRYAEDPEHLKVVDFVRSAIDERRVVDFEFP